MFMKILTIAFKTVYFILINILFPITKAILILTYKFMLTLNYASFFKGVAIITAQNTLHLVFKIIFVLWSNSLFIGIHIFEMLDPYVQYKTANSPGWAEFFTKNTINTILPSIDPQSSFRHCWTYTRDESWEPLVHTPKWQEKIAYILEKEKAGITLSKEEITEKNLTEWFKTRPKESFFIYENVYILVFAISAIVIGVSLGRIVV